MGIISNGCYILETLIQQSSKQATRAGTSVLKYRGIVIGLCSVLTAGFLLAITFSGKKPQYYRVHVYIHVEAKIVKGYKLTCNFPSILNRILQFYMYLFLEYFCNHLHWSWILLVGGITDRWDPDECHVEGEDTWNSCHLDLARRVLRSVPLIDGSVPSGLC